MAEPNGPSPEEIRKNAKSLIMETMDEWYEKKRKEETPKERTRPPEGPNIFESLFGTSTRS